MGMKDVKQNARFRCLLTIVDGLKKLIGEYDCI